MSKRHLSSGRSQIATVRGRHKCTRVVAKRTKWIWRSKQFETVRKAFKQRRARAYGKFSSTYFICSSITLIAIRYSSRLRNKAIQIFTSNSLSLSLRVYKMELQYFHAGSHPHLYQWTTGLAYRFPRWKKECPRIRSLASAAACLTQIGTAVRHRNSLNNYHAARCKYLTDRWAPSDIHLELKLLLTRRRPERIW